MDPSLLVVPAQMACPTCHEANMDKLLIKDDQRTVQCLTCKVQYDVVTVTLDNIGFSKVEAQMNGTQPEPGAGGPTPIESAVEVVAAAVTRDEMHGLTPQEQPKTGAVTTPETDEDPMYYGAW